MAFFRRKVAAVQPNWYRPRPQWPNPQTLLGWWAQLSMAGEFAQTELLPDTTTWYGSSAYTDTVDLEFDQMQAQLAVLGESVAVLAIAVDPAMLPTNNSHLSLPPDPAPIRLIPAEATGPVVDEAPDVWAAAPKWVTALGGTVPPGRVWMLAFYDAGTWWSVDIPGAINPDDLHRFAFPLLSKQTTLAAYDLISENRIIIENLHPEAFVEDPRWEDFAPTSHEFEALLDRGITMDSSKLWVHWKTEKSDLRDYYQETFEEFQGLPMMALDDRFIWGFDE